GRARSRRHPRARLDLPEHEPVDRSEPAAAAARTRPRRSRSRHRAVLRVAGRRLAVFQLHGRIDRERSTGRPQPRLLRGAQSTAADLAAAVAERSGGLQRLPRFLHRARARAPVVGTGGPLAPLPPAPAHPPPPPTLPPPLHPTSP